MNTVIIEKVKGYAPVYVKYDDCTEPQPAYLWLFPEKREVSADYSEFRDIAGDTWDSFCHRHVLTFEINPMMKAAAINRLMRDLQYMLSHICDGYSSVWCGNHFEASYTRVAEATIREVKKICKLYGQYPGNISLRRPKATHNPFNN